MNESQFYNLLKTQCVNLKMFRIETAQKDGFPDVLYINKTNGFQGLIELKAMVKMPTSIKRSGLRVEQNIFHLDWSRNGGTSYVLCWCDLEQVALLWKGEDVFPAWKNNTLGKYIIIPRDKLHQLINFIQ